MKLDRFLSTIGPEKSVGQLGRIEEEDHRNAQDADPSLPFELLPSIGDMPVLIV